MDALRSVSFNPSDFLAHAGVGRKLLHFKPKQDLFRQGSRAASVYFLQSGRAKLTVVSNSGKEATITLLKGGEFVGEEAIAAVGGTHLATATAVTTCSALKIEKSELVRVIHEEHSFSDMFLAFLLARSMRTQADLVDQLFNSSERRLARILLLMAEFGKSGEEQVLLPRITQETLAEMVGTTRSRVSFFMNRFRKLGFVEYNGRIKVHKSLLNVVLHDHSHGEEAQSAALLGIDRSVKRTRVTKAMRARSSYELSSTDHSASGAEYENPNDRDGG